MGMEEKKRGGKTDRRSCPPFFSEKEVPPVFWLSTASS